MQPLYGSENFTDKIVLPSKCVNIDVIDFVTKRNFFLRKQFFCKIPKISFMKVYVILFNKFQFCFRWKLYPRLFRVAEYSTNIGRKEIFESDL